MRINQIKYAIWNKEYLQFSAAEGDVYSSGETCDEIECALMFDTEKEAKDYIKIFDEDCISDFEVLKVTISYDFSAIKA